MKKNLFLIQILFLLICPKVNSQNLLFEKGYYFPAISESYYEHQQTLDGGFAILKCVNGDTNGLTRALIKTDVNGNVQWSTRLKWVSSGAFTDMMQSNDSSYFIGASEGPNQKTIVKCSSSGNILWLKKYDLGGQGNFRSEVHIICTSDGGCAMISQVLNWPNLQWLLVKVDMNGNLLWSKSVFEEVYIDGALQDLCECPNGDILIIGESSGLTSNNTAIVRVDSGGNFISGKIYPSNFYVVTGSIIALPDNGAVFSGNLPYTGFVAGRIDQSGNLLWYNQYPINDTILGTTEIINTPDGGYAIAGGFKDGLLIKLDSSGNSQWMTKVDTIAFHTLSLASDGFAMSGLTPSYRVFFVTTDQSGMNSCMINKPYATFPISQLNPVSLSFGNSIALTTTNPAFTQISQIPITSTVCFSINAIADEDTRSHQSIHLYPNPATDEIKIETNIPFQSLRLVDLTGKAVLVKESAGEKNTLNTFSLDPGIYFLLLETKEKTIEQKVIICR